MKRQIRANWENYFWDLHEKNMETGVALEEIIDNMGLSDKFFPEDGSEPTADELDYKTVIDSYGAQPASSEMIYRIMENIVKSIREVDGVTACYFDLHSNALRITTEDRKNYELSIEKTANL